MKKTETIKVVFEYEIEYETDKGRIEALECAKEGHARMRGCSPNGLYAAVRKSPGTVLEETS